MLAQTVHFQEKTDSIGYSLLLPPCYFLPGVIHSN
jgi:hypothetical protein